MTGTRSVEKKIHEFEVGPDGAAPVTGKSAPTVARERLRGFRCAVRVVVVAGVEVKREVVNGGQVDGHHGFVPPKPAPRRE